MEFGVALQWGDMRHIGLSPALKEVAKTARDLGFRSLWTTDQMSARSDNAFSTEPLITAASLMNIVPEMLLGVAVLVLPLRNAAVVAKQASTLSLLSGERFILGIGVGGHEAEASLASSDFTTRGQRVDESIEVMRRLWRDEGASFSGRFHNFEDVGQEPKPKAGHPPLWIGGSSQAAIRRAAKSGDGWVPALMSPSALADGVAKLRALRQGGKIPTVATMEMVHPHRPKDAASPMPVNIAGVPEEMIATLREYEEAGLEHLICSFNAYDLDEISHQMQTIAEDVMPHFSI